MKMLLLKELMALLKMNLILEIVSKIKKTLTVRSKKLSGFTITSDHMKAVNF